MQKDYEGLFDSVPCEILQIELPFGHMCQIYRVNPRATEIMKVHLSAGDMIKLIEYLDEDNLKYAREIIRRLRKPGDKSAFLLKTYHSAVEGPDRMTLKKLFEKWQEGMQQNNGWNALFWCNHDQPRIVSRMGDENRCWKESAKMLAAAVHMMRGNPYIYQGEELGKTNAHYTDISQYRDVESLNYYEILLS